LISQILFAKEYRPYSFSSCNNDNNNDTSFSYISTYLGSVRPTILLNKSLVLSYFKCVYIYVYIMYVYFELNISGTVQFQKQK
jgi:hypothetical protein